jgi:hypothetical protein
MSRLSRISTPRRLHEVAAPLPGAPLREQGAAEWRLRLLDRRQIPAATADGPGAVRGVRPGDAGPLRAAAGPAGLLQRLLRVPPGVDGDVERAPLLQPAEGQGGDRDVAHPSRTRDRPWRMLTDGRTDDGATIRGKAYPMQHARIVVSPPSPGHAKFQFDLVDLDGPSRGQRLADLEVTAVCASADLPPEPEQSSERDVRFRLRQYGKRNGYEVVADDEGPAGWR